MTIFKRKELFFWESPLSPQILQRFNFHRRFSAIQTFNLSKAKRLSNRFIIFHFRFLKICFIYSIFILISTRNFFLNVGFRPSKEINNKFKTWNLFRGRRCG